MRASRLLALLGLAAACRSGSLPTWEETAAPAAGSPAAAEPTAPPPAGEPAAAADPPVPGPPAPDGPAAAEPEPEPVAKAELPAPLHGQAKVDKRCGADPGIGQKLKPFSLRTPDGQPISPSTYRGRVLLVNFWGTWCKPCLQELPEFDQLYRRYRSHGLTLVAIATDEDPAPVKDFVDRRRIAARVAMGGESYASQYGSDKFPFSFVVDHQGVVRGSYRGYKPECMGKLEQDLRSALQRRGSG